MDDTPPETPSAKRRPAEDSPAERRVATDGSARDVSTPSAQDGASGDSISRDSVSKDSVAQDGVAKDGVSKDSVARGRAEEDAREFDHSPMTYLPLDRRHALADGRDLPNRSDGAALFADISGFTPLTEALVRRLGVRRGTEALPKQLNDIYDALIAEVNRSGGSVIGFSGDAITCWFGGDDGTRATVCALALQQAMTPFASLRVPGDDTVISLSIKVAVASGPVRRFLVGDAAIQQIEVLAGETLTRMSTAEGFADRGEVSLDARSAERLADRLTIARWHHDPVDGRPLAAIVTDIRSDTRSNVRPNVRPNVQPNVRPNVRADAYSNTRSDTRDAEVVATGSGDDVVLRPWLPEAAYQSLSRWLLPAVHQRLRGGQGEFLTELRPATALFVRFGGIDYDGDEAAGDKLGAYITWVQKVVERFEGALIQVSVGDKGSYLYIAFGAPVAHEDDAQRAAATALTLQRPPAELGFIGPGQMGLSAGTMRTGAYGSRTRRTYGVLGDDVNLAARLMMKAAPGEIIASERVYRSTQRSMQWRQRAPVRVKGKRDPITVYQLLDTTTRRSTLQAQPSDRPLVGRDRELALLREGLEHTRSGHGRLVGVTAEAGMGKSRLVAELLRDADRLGARTLVGDCQSYGTDTPYLVWQDVARSLLGVPERQSYDASLQALRDEVVRLGPDLLPRLPLLAPILNLPIPDNALTQALEPERRKTLRETLFVDLLRAKLSRSSGASSTSSDAPDQTPAPWLLVLEDVHWIDALSRDLLDEVVRAVPRLPLLVVLAYRPLGPAQQQLFAALSAAHATEISLSELPPAEIETLVATRLGVAPGDLGDLVARLSERAQGNPFYVEELLNYIQDQGLEPTDPATWQTLVLPTSLQSLILSRIDRISDRQQALLKTASVIGRSFRLDWLSGYFPRLGDVAALQRDLGVLDQLDLTLLDRGDAAGASAIYAFRHIMTRDVAYESLAHTTRTDLHTRLAHFLETYARASDQPGRYLDLLAYHYGHSDDVVKQRHYFGRAADAARVAYANDSAIGYYERRLPLLEEPDERIDTLLLLGQVLQHVGRWDEAQRRFEQARETARRAKLTLGAARSARALGWLLVKRGDYQQALVWLEDAYAGCRDCHGEPEARLLAQVYVDLGTTYFRTREFDKSVEYLEAAVSRARDLGDDDTVARAELMEGNVAYVRGRLEPARQHYETSLALYRQLGDKARASDVLNNLGIVARRLEHFDEATRRTEESLGIAKEIGARDVMARCLNSLGGIAWFQDNLVAARGYFEASLELRREMGATSGTSVVLSNLGLIAYRQRRFAEADALHRESLALSEGVGDTEKIANALNDLGDVALVQERWADAGDYYRRALETAHRIDLHKEVAVALAGLALATLRRRESVGPASEERALGWLAAAQHLQGEMGGLEPYEAEQFQDKLAAAAEAVGQAGLAETATLARELSAPKLAHLVRDALQAPSLERRP